MSKFSYAAPGEVGLLYTDEQGGYHIFVSALTKEQPALKVDQFEVIIKEKE